MGEDNSAIVGDERGDSSKALSILFVEDEALIRMTTMDMLDELGYSAREAGSGEEALRLLEEARSDIVLTDLGLPGMSGAAFGQEVRRRWPDIAIVFATGMDQAPSLEATGRTALIKKPFSADELRSVLASLPET